MTYTVSAALGLDTSGYSFSHVASWADGKSDDEMHACLQAVRDEARVIIENLQETIAA